MHRTANPFCNSWLHIFQEEKERQGRQQKTGLVVPASPMATFGIRISYWMEEIHWLCEAVSVLHICLYNRRIWAVCLDSAAGEWEGMASGMWIISHEWFSQVECLSILIGRGRKGVLRKRLRAARTYQVCLDSHTAYSYLPSGSF